MSRLKQAIAKRLGKGGKLLIPYLVAGDPGLDVSLRLMNGLVSAGADIIELGMPFTDPSSDGAVIQKGAERALASGTTLSGIFGLMDQFRSGNDHTPVVLMGYLNPVEIMGYEVFADACAAHGVDGVLLVDLPPIEAGQLAALLRDRNVDMVFLVAPTTSAARARAIVDCCSGYLYYVSLKGVTGAAISDLPAIRDAITGLRSLTSLPIVVGFGVKTPEDATSLAGLADGVVIGSALVSRIAGLSLLDTFGEEELHQVVDLIARSRAALEAL